MNALSRDKSSDAPEKGATRRDFGKGALWVAPALTVLLAASSQPVNANVPYPNGLPK